ETRKLNRVETPFAVANPGYVPSYRQSVTDKKRADAKFKLASLFTKTSNKPSVELDELSSSDEEEEDEEDEANDNEEIWDIVEKRYLAKIVGNAIEMSAKIAISVGKS
ncbi:hypothetical protein PFISCL1PPCAC_23340, partial [Pristionchus fissidentatus]